MPLPSGAGTFFLRVYDLAGKYTDAFWLKLNGPLLAVSNDVVFVREKAPDESIRIVGYKVVGPSP